MAAAGRRFRCPAAPRRNERPNHEDATRERMAVVRA